MKHLLLVITIVLAGLSDSDQLSAQSILTVNNVSPVYTGSGSAWDVGQGLTIGITGSGGMYLNSNATVTSTMGTLGKETGSYGYVDILFNASWENSGTLTVGESGSGYGYVDANSQLTSTDASMGKNSGGSGELNIYGGSYWENSGSLTVGESGYGLLKIDGSNSLVRNTEGSVGKNVGSTGVVTISSNAEWENYGNLSVGESGQGSLTIDQGGRASSDHGYIGKNSGAIGDVVIRDRARWSNQGDFTVGHEGNGMLTVEASGSVSNQNGFVGASAGSTGSVSLLNSARWRNYQDLIVGGQGTGTLVVDNQADVISVGGVIGQGVSSTGVVTLTDRGRWDMTGDFIVGEFGSGTLTIETNSVVTNVRGTIGLELGSTGFVTVKSGGRWDNSAELYVSRFGDGKLIIEDGVVTSKEGYVATAGIGSTGEVLVKGQSARWDVEDSLHIGAASGDGSGVSNSSVGIFSIEGGAKVTAGSFRVSGGTDADRRSVLTIKENSHLEVGQGSGSNGGMSINNANVMFESGALVDNSQGVASIGSRADVTVSGTNTYWLNRKLDVGGEGDSILNIENGGRLDSFEGGTIGTSSGSGTVKVSGAGSQWVNYDFLTIGDRAVGELLIESGGRVTSRNDAILGGFGANNSRAEVTVTGVDSSWHHAGDVYLDSGDFIDSKLNVDLNGSVQIDGHLTVGSTSQVNLSGGTMTVQTINMEDGELNLSGGVAVVDKIDLRGGEVNLSGGKLDVGTLEFSNGVPLDFNMTGGRLVVDSILGDFQQDGGTLAPGDSPGLTAITGDYDLIAGMIEFEIGGLTRVTDFDAVDVGGITTLNGTMDVNLINGFTGSLGDSFQLVDSAGGILGNPMFNFLDASLASGLAWDTSTFLSNGTIFITAAVPEPTSFLMFGIACSCLASRRRKSRT